MLHEPAVAHAITVRPEVLARLEERLDAGDRESVETTLMSDVAGMSDEDVGLFRRQPAFAARVAAAHTIPREHWTGSAYRFLPERFARMEVPTLILLGSESMPVDAASASG